MDIMLPSTSPVKSRPVKSSVDVVDNTLSTEISLKSVVVGDEKVLKMKQTLEKELQQEREVRKRGMNKKIEGVGLTYRKEGVKNGSLDSKCIYIESVQNNTVSFSPKKNPYFCKIFEWWNIAYKKIQKLFTHLANHLIKAYPCLILDIRPSWTGHCGLCGSSKLTEKSILREKDRLCVQFSNVPTIRDLKFLLGFLQLMALTTYASRFFETGDILWTF